MFRKFTALCVSLMFLVVAGCATTEGPSFMDKMTAAIQKGCTHKEEWMEIKAGIGSALQTVQVGYPVMVAAINSFKSNALDPAKVDAGVAPALAQAAIVDKMLDVLGQLYFDKVCPTEEDLEKAEAALAVAQAAQAQVTEAAK